MSWLTGKKNNNATKDIEKGSEKGSISSFGSISEPRTYNVILPPRQAHLASHESPNQHTFVNPAGSTNSSNGFTSSFPVSEGTKKRPSFIRRHAFIILLITAVFLACSIATIAVLLKQQFVNRQTVVISTDQTRPDNALPSTVNTLTAALAEI